MRRRREAGASASLPGLCMEEAGANLFARGPSAEDAGKLAQVGQLTVSIAVLGSAKGYFGQKLLTTFGISIVPIWLSQARGQFDAEEA